MVRLFSCLGLILWSLSLDAQTSEPVLDVQHYDFSLRLYDSTNRIEGAAEINAKFLRSVKSFEFDLSNAMVVSSVTEKGKPLRFTQDSNSMHIESSAKEGTIHTYKILYSGVPKDGLIISKNKFGNRTFFGDNWPNRAHDWLPCHDDPGDKASMDMNVTAPDYYQVVSNGIKIDETPLTAHQKLTHWRERVPLPTKVMVIGVARFSIGHPGDVEEIPVYSYVFPENAQQGFDDYRVATRILPYYIHLVGPYAYAKLANVQSKTIYGGMENASCIFYYENSVGDKGIEPLMAHEIAHQWFGDAVTEKNYHHLWLSEGFATFMTHVYMEHRYGEDTLRAGMRQDRQRVIAFVARHHGPVVDTGFHGNWIQLLNANSYQKGGWVLHMLRHRLGDSVFWRGIRAYYAKYDGSNASTGDFEQVMEQQSGENLGGFFRQWLYTPGVPKLNVHWTYDTTAKALKITVDQPPEASFDVPLEFSIDTDSTIYTVPVNGPRTAFSVPLPSAPTTVRWDPHVELLADIKY